MPKITTWILIVVLIVGLLLIFVFDWGQDSKNLPPDGRDNLPRISTPTPNQLVRSPLVITGEAPGNWFFEASLPISLIDSSGNVIVIAPAQAMGDWMTTDYVPFSATLEFEISNNLDSGFLVVAKDNPSGLPENDQEIRIPVLF